MSATSQEVGDYVIIPSTDPKIRVKLAKHKITGEIVALKTYKKSQFETNPEFHKSVMTEIAIMQLFDHPNLLKCSGVYESRRHLYVASELAENRELFDYIVENAASLSYTVALGFLRQIVYAVEHMHWHGICHRDLKSENILLDKFNNVKIWGFKHAKIMTNNVVVSDSGSPHYVAPEVISGGSYDGRKADVWSIGVIFYALLTGRLPFLDKSIRKMFDLIKSGKYDMPDAPPDIQDLLKRMLTVAPEKRISLPEIRCHPGFRKGISGRYIFPSPVPMLNIREKLDINLVTKKVLTAMNSLGFDDDDLIKKKLESEGTNTVKWFVMALSRSLAIHMLPWSQSEREIPLQRSGSFDFVVEAGMIPFGSFSDRVMMSGPLSVGHGSVDMFSVIERSLLTHPVDASVTVVASQVIPDVEGDIEDLMTEIQQFLSTIGFVWFYPNQVMLVARRSSDNFEMVVHARNSATKEKAYDLEIHVPTGSMETFTRIIDRMTELLDGLLIL